MNTLERLQDGRDKIARGWCQGSFIRRTDLLSPDPSQYCALGAIGSVGQLLTQKERDERIVCYVRLDEAVKSIHPHFEPFDITAPGSTIVCFNDRDTTTQADDLAAFDLAIANEQKQRRPDWAKTYVGALEPIKEEPCTA